MKISIMSEVCKDFCSIAIMNAKPNLSPQLDTPCLMCVSASIGSFNIHQAKKVHRLTKKNKKPKIKVFGVYTFKIGYYFTIKQRIRRHGCETTQSFVYGNWPEKECHIFSVVKELDINIASPIVLLKVFYQITCDLSVSFQVESRFNLQRFHKKLYNDRQRF